MKPFASPPTPEPLSDLSWHRLERDLFDALDNNSSASAPVPASRTFSRRGVALVATGICLAAAALMLLVLWPAGEQAVTSNQISRLVTQDSSSAMSIGDASLTADPHTALLVADNGANGVAVMLERGAVDCVVAARHGRAPFRVISGAVVVEVTGTSFRVERVGDSAVVIVAEGTVTVLSEGVLSRVSAGQRWPRQSAAIEPTPDDAPAITPGTRIEDTAKATRAEDAAKATPPAAKHSAPKQRVTPKPTPGAKERYRAAARLESSDPTAALTIYKRLAREGGPWSATALFAQGRLELERGSKTRARRTLERYLRKYPGGVNAADARALLDQLK